MKLNLSALRATCGGYALLMVLTVTGVCLVVLAATLNRNSATAALNDRNNQYVASMYAAEAATEKVLAKMGYDFAVGNLTTVTNHLSQYQGYYPTGSENAYWNNFQFSDGQGNLNHTYATCYSNSGFVPLKSQFTGLSGWVNNYRVVSNAKMLGTRYDITNAVQQDVALTLIPVFQFAVFYNSLLEFTTCAPLTINGRTHANSNIFVGSTSALIFNSTVTSTRAVTNPPWAGQTQGSYSGAVTYNGAPQKTILASALTLPIGTNAASGGTNYYNNPNAVREIINLPPAGEDPDSTGGQARLFNKAAVVLLVSNSTVTVQIKTSGSDTPTNIVAGYNSTNYTAVNTNFPWLNITNTFTDQREGDLVKVTQVDIGKLGQWLITNGAVKHKFPTSTGVYTNNAPNIFYAADNRTYGGSEMTAIRLTNGVVIPTNTISYGSSSNMPSGFTVVTPNPLYVLGNYNCPDSSALSQTNTSKTFPAGLISDAITILSGAWSDSLSSGSYAARNATSTTVNAAILAGVVYSTGPAKAQYSGGAHNLTRLLEDWSGQTLTLNTSLVNLYNSVRATAQFQFPGVYYGVPSSRKFSFDMNFLDYRKLPPGTPAFPTMSRQKWVLPPPNTVNYAGN